MCANKMCLCGSVLEVAEFEALLVFGVDNATSGIRRLINDNCIENGIFTFEMLALMRAVLISKHDGP